jgi:hypothetical protein
LRAPIISKAAIMAARAPKLSQAWDRGISVSLDFLQ